MYTASPNPQSISQPPDLLSQFRVRTVAEIIDVSFRVYRRNFIDFILIILLVAVPLQVLSYVADVFLLGRFSPPDFSGGTGSFSSRLATSTTVSQIAGIKDYLENFLLYFAQWALTSALVTSVFGGVVTLRSAFSAVRHNFGRALGLVVLQTLITIGIYSPLLIVLVFGVLGGNSSIATVLSCVVGLVSLANYIVDIRLKLALPAAVVEGLSPREAIRRSFNLTRNYWWRTLALVFVLGLLSTVIAAGPAALVASIFGVGANGIYTTLALTRFISILTMAFFAPIEMGAIALYYFDQRVRLEGYDLESAISGRYDSGAYTQPPNPGYFANDTSSSNTYGQPTLGYGYSTPDPNVPTYYDESSRSETSRVRRVPVQNTQVAPITTDMPTDSPEATT